MVARHKCGTLLTSIPSWLGEGAVMKISALYLHGSREVSKHRERLELGSPFLL